MKKWFLVVLLVFALVFWCFATPVSAATTQTFIGGTIRNTGAGWYVLNNSAHKPLGITGVSANGEYITISYAAQLQVITFAVTVDETMAAEGYTVGASVGLYQTFIYIYDANHNRINPNTYINSAGNIWIQGWFLK